ncbi:NAD-P-binding protein [Lentinus tigrinus ALCF2SS1-7]|uniref:NAD-P-binding protein n=1 Tax=Lentinus tigrinus ALCF2SS1-6 TaxID=1328759 RepID=A0A5C2SPG3_9APHY|nr:NAD-P-binding protein [Lentinus tigrinus ALCF2SS1-6]RPD78922.1 NAD-P-binding protein [Lentinus tigrinus ALCF2SS1-7]
MGFFSSNKEPKFDPAKDLPDLTGKVVIVTGGNSGIGFATVQHLARKGAKVYLTARNEERAKAALERLNAEGLAPGNGTVVWLELDLSDPRKAKKSAESFLEKETRLDVLVNNAGLMSDTYQKNSDGTHLADPAVASLFSTFVFTRTLVPVLTQTAKEPNSDVRVVFVSSMAMGLLKGKGMRFRNLEDLNEKFSGMLAPMQRYAKSKLAQALVAKQFQRKFDEESVPITVLSLHPGTVYTEGVSKDPNLQMPVIGPLLNFFVRKTFASPSEGAHTSVFAAASPKVKAERDKYKGAFLWPPGKLSEPPVPEFDNTELAEEVWNTVETHLKEWGV